MGGLSDKRDAAVSSPSLASVVSSMTGGPATKVNDKSDAAVS
jgi:hypothetical protein